MQYQHWLVEATSTGSIVTCVEAKHMRILTICVYMCVSHTLDIHNICVYYVYFVHKDICLGVYFPFIFVPKDTFPAIDQGFEETCWKEPGISQGHWVYVLWRKHRSEPSLCLCLSYKILLRSYVWIQFSRLVTPRLLFSVNRMFAKDLFRDPKQPNQAVTQIRVQKYLKWC